MPSARSRATPQADPQWYSVEEVAQRLNLHPRTVRNHVRDGRLQATRIGKQYRISPDALDRYLRPPAETSARPPELRADVSAVVHISGGNIHTAQRLAQAALSAVSGSAEQRGISRVETALDPERGELRLIILAPPTEAAAILATVATLVDALQLDLHQGRERAPAP